MPHFEISVILFAGKAYLHRAYCFSSRNVLVFLIFPMVQYLKLSAASCGELQLSIEKNPEKMVKCKAGSCF